MLIVPLRFFYCIAVFINFLFIVPFFSAWADDTAVPAASPAGIYEGALLYLHGDDKYAENQIVEMERAQGIVEVKEYKPGIYSVEGYELRFKEPAYMEPTYRISGTYRLDNNAFKGTETELDNGRETNMTQDAEGRFMQESTGGKGTGESYFFITLAGGGYGFKLYRADPASMTSVLQKTGLPSITIESPTIYPVVPQTDKPLTLKYEFRVNDIPDTALTLDEELTITGPGFAPVTFKGTCRLSDFEHSSIGPGHMNGHGKRERVISALKPGQYKCEIKLTAGGYPQAAAKEISFTVKEQPAAAAQGSKNAAYWASLRRKLPSDEAKSWRAGFTRNESVPVTSGAVTESQPKADPNAPKVEDSALKSDQVILQARLESSVIELIPGEPSKIDGVYVKGWRSNTADRVEVEMEVIDNWGTLKVNPKIIAAPGPTSADPSNMADKEYYFSQMWSARLGARPGTFRVPIIVKQKDAESAAVFLIVRIMPKKSSVAN